METTWNPRSGSGHSLRGVLQFQTCRTQEVRDDADLLPGSRITLLPEARKALCRYMVHASALKGSQCY